MQSDIEQDRQTERQTYGWTYIHTHCQIDGWMDRQNIMTSCHSDPLYTSSSCNSIPSVTAADVFKVPVSMNLKHAR